MSGKRIPGVVCVLVVIVFTGCRQDMHDQPRYKPLGGSAFFADGRAARPLVAGTVPRGHLRADAHFHTGRVGDELVSTFPAPVNREVLERGRERYGIFCAPCHGGLGDGEGMVVKRGYRQPPSFHIDRLREAPVGHFFDSATNGFGAMPGYASRIPPGDRWAIIAYICALQASQRATLADVPAETRKQLESMP